MSNKSEYIRTSTNGKAFLVKKIKGGSRFSKAAVKMVAFLTENFDFNVGNITVNKDT